MNATMLVTHLYSVTVAVQCIVLAASYLALVCARLSDTIVLKFGMCPIEFAAACVSVFVYFFVLGGVCVMNSYAEITSSVTHGKQTNINLFV